MEKRLLLCVLALLGLLALCAAQTATQPATSLVPIKMTVTFYAPDGQPEQRGLVWRGVTNLRIVNASLPQAKRFANAIPIVHKDIILLTDHNVTSMTDPIFYRLTSIDNPEVDVFALDYFLGDFALQFAPCSAVGFTLTGTLGTFSWECRHFAAFPQPGEFPNGRPPIGYPTNFNDNYPQVIGKPTPANGPSTWRPRYGRDLSQPAPEEEKQ